MAYDFLRTAARARAIGDVVLYAPYTGPSSGTLGRRVQHCTLRCMHNIFRLRYISITAPRPWASSAATGRPAAADPGHPEPEGTIEMCRQHGSRYEQQRLICVVSHSFQTTFGPQGFTRNPPIMIHPSRGPRGRGVVSNNWFNRVFTLKSLHVQTLTLTDVQTIA